MSWIITGTQKNNWDPSLISTALWLDAADASTITESGGVVTAWNDKSGNDRNATASGTDCPTYSATGFNGKPTIDFDVGNKLDLVQFAQLSGQNVWIVADTTLIGSGFRVALQRDPATANNLLFLFGGTTRDYAPTVFWNIKQPAVWESAVQRKAIIRWSFYVGSTSSALVQVDGQTAITGSVTASDLSNWSAINKTDIQQSNVDISEIVMTPTDLSTNDREKMEGYLAHKWGLTANLPADHPYKTAVPVP